MIYFDADLRNRVRLHERGGVETLDAFPNLKVWSPFVAIW